MFNVKHACSQTPQEPEDSMIDALEEAKCIPFTDPSWGLNGTYNHWVLSVILSSHRFLPEVLMAMYLKIMNEIDDLPSKL